MQQQSQKFCKLVAMSDELIVLMICIANVVDTLISDQQPKLVLVPLTHPMVMTNSTITSNPAAPAPETTNPLFPRT